jgi:hypothetical protein
MKIFSLETKKHLAGWSVVVGLVIDFLLYWLAQWLYKPCTGFCPDSVAP